MPRYIEVVSATTETATKILALRAGDRTRRTVSITTNGGATASVSWSDDLSEVTLNMPTLPPDAIMTRAEADRLVAFIIHECCHVLHSDRAAWEQAVRAGTRVRDWTNALEDVRIECREIEEGHFPAMQGLLASMTNHLHYEAVIASRKHHRIIGAMVADAPYVACILGRIANGYSIPAAGGLAGDMSSQVDGLLNHALGRIYSCRNTDDVVTLARELVDMEQALPPLPPPNNPGDQGDQGKGDQGEGEGEGEGQDGQEGEGEGQGGPKTDASLDSMVEAIAKRAGYNYQSALNMGDGSHTLSTTRNDVVTMPRLPGSNAASCQHAAKALGDRLPKNSVLHGQIGRLLVSAEVHRVTHHESSGRLDRRALVRMRVGAPDVYSRRDDTPGIDTALLILVDGSVSMGTFVGYSTVVTRMAIAQATAWHIAKAAEAAGAKVAVASFHTRRDLRGRQVNGATIKVVKPWAVAAADRAGELAEVRADSATPLSPAIIRAAALLAEVNATRHILMVLTDGECDLGPMAVTRACAVADSMGVETVGIGMSCASVTAAFPPRYSVNVEDLAQLAAKGLGALVAMLEDASPREAD